MLTSISMHYSLPTAVLDVFDGSIASEITSLSSAVVSFKAAFRIRNVLKYIESDM